MNYLYYIYYTLTFFKILYHTRLCNLMALRPNHVWASQHHPKYQADRAAVPLQTGAAGILQGNNWLRTSPLDGQRGDVQSNVPSQWKQIFHPPTISIINDVYHTQRARKLHRRQWRANQTTRYCTIHVSILYTHQDDRRICIYPPRLRRDTRANRQDSPHQHCHVNQQNHQITATHPDTIASLGRVHPICHRVEGSRVNKLCLMIHFLYFFCLMRSPPYSTTHSFFPLQIK